MHVAAPGVLEKDPALHALQLELVPELGYLPYVPALQDVHEVLPLPVWYVPVGQGVHAAVGPVEKEPGLQLTQL